MAQTATGRFLKGPYKPRGRNCDIYFLNTVRSLTIFHNMFSQHSKPVMVRSYSVPSMIFVASKAFCGRLQSYARVCTGQPKDLLCSWWYFL